MSDLRSVNSSTTGPWPEVVQFRAPDGVLESYPPIDGRSYKTVVHKLELYEELARSGLLYRLFSASTNVGHGQAWRSVLELPLQPAKVTMEDVSKAYRLMSMKCHPDQGGSAEAMIQLGAARDAARADLEFTS